MVAVIICTQCGVNNQIGTDFCTNCDEYVGDLAPTDAAADIRGDAAADGVRADAPVDVPVVLPSATTHDTPFDREQPAVEPASMAQLDGDGGVSVDDATSDVDDRSATGAPRGPAGPGPAVLEALRDLDEAQALVEQAGRADLVRRLAAARAQLLAPDLLVAVVGEFKKGKSTLVNAALQAGVCPTDADIATAVPTLVRHGRPPRALGHRAEAGDDVAPEELPVDGLAAHVTSGGAGRYRLVEVFLDRRVLRAGLSFLDTPGVGGIDSAHATITLGVLPMVAAAVFVTDASQELTEPEVDFLRQAVERCPSVLCVVTKTDLSLEWKRIVDLDRQHLRRAGLEVPVVPVSSLLRLRAASRRDAAMNRESGFPALFDALRERVLADSDRLRVAVCAREVAFVVEQVRQPLAVEQQVLERPEQAEALVERLAEAEDRSDKVRRATASWQTALNDGLADIASDVEHDVRERFFRLLDEGEEILDRSDPKEIWDDFEGWVQKQVAAQVVANHDLLMARAAELVERVGEQFAAESDEALKLVLDIAPARVEIMARLSLDLEQGGGSVMGAFGALRMAQGGVLVSSLGGHLLAAAAGLSLTSAVLVVSPLGLAVGAGLGHKLLHAERQRRLEQRRQAAKNAFRKYVNEAVIVVSKGTRDALRVVQRQLRDGFVARAEELHESSARALASARRAAALTPEERRGREREVDRALGRVEVLAERNASAAQAVARRAS